MRAQVRKAGPLDIPLIAAMHADSFAEGCGGEVWSETAIAEILAMPGAYGLIIHWEPGGEPGGERGRGALGDVEGKVGSPQGLSPAAAGFLLGREMLDECEILSLGVPRAWRRRGAARTLLRAALERARHAGIYRAILDVAEDNSAARDLYSSEGFAVIARRSSYYRRSSGPAVAALVFARVEETGKTGP